MGQHIQDMFEEFGQTLIMLNSPSIRTSNYWWKDNNNDDDDDGADYVDDDDDDDDDCDCFIISKKIIKLINFVR